MLDFGVPIGAFDQTHHDPPIMPLGHFIKIVDDAARTSTIGLDHHAETIPRAEVGVVQYPFNDMHRKVEPVGLFRVDVQAHPGSRGLAGKAAHHRHKLGQNAFGLCDFVSGMKGG